MTKLVRILSASVVLVILAACAASSSAPGVGVWDVNVSTPVGDQASVWTLAADGTGMMAGDQGDQALEGVMMEGNMITFDVEIDAGGQSLALSFSGTVDGDMLTGEFDSPFGAFAVTGTRQ